MQNDPDATTIQLIRNGMTDAYAQIVKRYATRALSLASRFIRDHHAAEDVVQDAFIRAFTALPSFKGDALFSTWFYRIVYNTAMNAAQQQRRKPDLTEIDEESLVVWTDTDMFDRLEAAELDMLLQESIDAIPPLYAVVLDLLYVQDRRYDEIVAITGLPLGTVKTRLNRGRAMLRAEMMHRCPEMFLERTP